ncbi:mediator of RNA polymerase II transcription subunit 15a-like isoform X4 [Populus alba x Populus x berolinensis]|uniref:Mediator of RNA polymerase II transcription subunit 15a-like isoform X4 n=2 Tax=Populus TaxID=3689 RepID=A0AAD6R6Y0_9ROSI|nr:mediator of RNA polymerase II transcription subunit 15a-like isoform X4 [Populus alba x Populus x berolinensis]
MDIRSQNAMPTAPMDTKASLDSTAQTGHAKGADWQEEIYQKIKVMKETYFQEINERYQRIAAKLQQLDSHLQQPKSEQLEKLEVFKAMLEHLITFLQVSKNITTPSFKEKLGSYEKQIGLWFDSYKLRANLQRDRQPHEPKKDNLRPLQASHCSPVPIRNRD